eukprot:1505152-Pleurochrysis_carterae.AAC.1
MPKASAAGMESEGSESTPARSRCSTRSAAVAAAWSSAARAAVGHASDTSHAVIAPVASGANAYPPTPSTPL